MTRGLECRRMLHWVALPWMAALSVMGAGREARACQPGSGIVSDVIPSGDTHPANAAVVLFGSALTEWDLTATVDGVAVAISVNDSLSHLLGLEGGYRSLALRFDPEPEPGQEVVVSGQPCPYSPTSSCDDFEVRYIAEERDTTRPTFGALDWGYDAEYISPIPDPDEWYIDSCSEYPGAGSVTVSGSPTQPFDQDVVLVITGRRTSTAYGGQEKFRYFGRLDTDFEVRMPVYVDQVASPPSESEFCFSAKLVDAAGNASEVQEICSPCTITQGDSAACLPEAPSCRTTVDLAEFETCHTDSSGAEPTTLPALDAGQPPSPSSSGGRTSSTSEPDDAGRRVHDDTRRGAARSSDTSGCTSALGRPTRASALLWPWLLLFLWRRHRG